jgi:CTP synthase (UTP-ammonia lyase)
MKIRLLSDSLAFRIYQKPEVEEQFNCSYELNPAYQGIIEAKGLRITGIGENGEARIVELAGRRFFLATAFQPQFTSEVGRPHPLILSYLIASLNFRGG